MIEEDPGDTSTEKHVINTKKVNSSKINGSIKIGLGLSDNNTINTDIGAENNYSTTIDITHEISVTRTNKDDHLGDEDIYFYDSIIESKSGSMYNARVYNTGVVKFGLSAI